MAIIKGNTRTFSIRYEARYRSWYSLTTLLRNDGLGEELYAAVSTAQQALHGKNQPH